MKKIFSSMAIAAGFCFKSICAFAEPTDTLVIDRVEAVDYLLLAGAGVFLLGMLFILLSMYAGIKNKKVSKSELDTYDEYDYDDEDAVSDADYAEQPVAKQEQETIAEPDPQAEIEPQAEAEPEIDPEPLAEQQPEIEAQDEPQKEKAEEEPALDEEQEEQEEQEEEQKNVPKVRITLTGTNNSDVKIMEFTDKATIGRRSENDIIISDNAVSGNHCEFVYEEGKLYLADLDSTNGTLVNDEPVIRTEINSGDTIIIGKHKYKISVTM